MMLIFLDIDGVLRRRRAPLYRFEAPLRETFEGFLRDAPEARVVIASSWREGFSLGEIRRHFSEDLRERVIGATPVSASREGPYREREVRAWLKRHGEEASPWVALEDDPELYGAGAPVVYCDPDTGLDAAAIAAVRAALAGGADPRG